MKGYQKKILIILILLALIILTRAAGISEYLTFENLQKNKTQLQYFVENNYPQAVVGFILTYIAVAGLSLPGATILTLSGGFLFGTLPAAIYANVGATLGAAAAFIFARYLVGHWFQEKYQEKLNKFNQELALNGFSYLLTLRFIPIFPLFLINILAGLTQIPLRTFIWTTSAGILPGSLVYTFAGSQLNTIESPQDIFSVKILIAFLLLALFALVPAVYNYFKRKRTA